MTGFLHAGLVLEYEPGRFLVGSGVVDVAPQRDPTRVAFYLPDFYLNDPAPWHHPEVVDDLDAATLAARLGDGLPPVVGWIDPARDRYARSFATIQAAIARQGLTKAVPAVFTHGTTEASSTDIARGVLRHLLEGTGSRSRYGWWQNGAGMLGASPELLFRILPGRVETQAIAGTAPLAEAERLLNDPKEVVEHQSVVQDIRSVLAPFGRVDIGPRELLALPDLAHLRTDITLRPTTAVQFEGLVAALHPTAALGVAPRTVGLDLLRALDDDAPRGRFGAPFGVALPDGNGVCVVAIRNVQWNGPDLVLGTGGGVIAESRLDREWDEITLKRTAVRRMLGL